MRSPNKFIVNYMIVMMILGFVALIFPILFTLDIDLYNDYLVNLITASLIIAIWSIISGVIGILYFRKFEGFQWLGSGKLFVPSLLLILGFLTLLFFFTMIMQMGFSI